MVEPQARLDELIARLKERGGRLTPQRVAVLKVLATSDQHPSAEHIYEHMKADFPMTSLATVYKTLALLVEMGELLEIRFCGDSTRYDGRIARSHPHLICVKCKKIEDLEITPLDPLSKEVAERTGYCILSTGSISLGFAPSVKRRNRSLQEEDNHPSSIILSRCQLSHQRVSSNNTGSLVPGANHSVPRV